MLADHAPLHYGADEAAILRALRPQAPLVRPSAGWRVRAEARSSYHSNPSEGSGGPGSLALRQDAGLLSWWRPLAWGPQLMLSLDGRGRAFLSQYGADAVGSLAFVGTQPLWGPASAYLGLGALSMAGGLGSSALGWASANAGLSLAWQAGPWEVASAAQLDRVVGSGGLAAWAQTGRVSLAWRPDAAWLGASELLLQARPSVGSLLLRQRITLSVDHAWPSGWELGAFVQSVGSLDQPVSDVAVGPRLRWGFR